MKIVEYPVRVGRKSKRSILDNNGNLIVMFEPGYDSIAILVAELLNRNYREGLIISIMNDDERDGLYNLIERK